MKRYYARHIEEDKIFASQVVAEHNKYRYPEKECQTDLDLNGNSFKYGNYDYAIGRFMSGDPSGEKIPFQPHYMFDINGSMERGYYESAEKSETKPYKHNSK